MQLHTFGVAIFVPIGVKRIDQFEYEPDDPFCYHCGQKLINVKLEDVDQKTCPGPDPEQASLNVKVYG